LKLSKRLKQIEQTIVDNYDHIWDCCCDHGSLGMSLLCERTAPNIHFVDIVPDLINKVEQTLQQFFSDSPSTWKTYCMDVAQLPLQQYTGKQLVIIAGVGGDLITQFVQSIVQHNPTLEIDFLLCPVHHQYALRQELVNLDFGLKHEALIEENNRFYEIILVSTSINDLNTPISLVGDKLWQSDTIQHQDIAQRYLTKTIKHYQRTQQGNTVDVDDIINAYQRIKI